jgi:hypothetical protein
MFGTEKTISSLLNKKQECIIPVFYYSDRYYSVLY